jgi:tetratricopeptide (TPR) repeat protein
MSSKDMASAERIAQGALDPASPHEALLSLLVDIKIAAKEHGIAEKLLLLGKKRFPALAHWNKRLAKLYASQRDNQRLEPVLIELVATEEDDPSIPAKLADLAVARKDTVAVERWSKATLQIDVNHAPSHARLAEVFTAKDKLPAAIREWQAAVRANDKEAAWKLSLARLLLRTGEREQAEALLEDLVETAPGLPGLVEATQELRQ